MDSGLGGLLFLLLCPFLAFALLGPLTRLEHLMPLIAARYNSLQRIATHYNLLCSIHVHA